MCEWVCVCPAQDLVASSITGVPVACLNGDVGHERVCQEDGELRPAKTNPIKP